MCFEHTSPPGPVCYPRDMENRNIEHYRNEIDRVDDDLLQLFNERAHYAIEIGLEKRRLGLPIEVPEREAGIIQRMIAANHGPLDQEAILRLFETVIGESRIAERAMLEG
jgi:chorismate mutase